MKFNKKFNELMNEASNLPTITINDNEYRIEGKTEEDGETMYVLYHVDFGSQETWSKKELEDAGVYDKVVKALEK